jgi:subtilisin family serine protease
MPNKAPLATRDPSWRRTSRIVGLSGALALIGPMLVFGAPGAAAVPATSAASPWIGELVVKTSPGASIERIRASVQATLGSTILASRSIYLLRVPVTGQSTDPKKAQAKWKAIANSLVHQLKADPEVEYAEANTDADSTEGERFHYWPNGGPECTGHDQSVFSQQPAVQELHLTDAHGVTGGDGTVIAILDTGVTLTHPALQGRIAAGGYDYVDDDADPNEHRDGVDNDGDGRTDEGYGHGTFVAGLAALVAPQARILPERVLDSEGHGNVFVVAEAVFDAVAAGADVINLSFGTAAHFHSKVLDEAIHSATKAGVVVVAAAGNDGTGAEHYPAALPGVLAVGAMDATGSGLASFSSRGKWVDVAAPGTDVGGPLPCGYGIWSGTSMAAPLVSGGAALLVSHTRNHKTTTDGLDKTMTESCAKVKGLMIKSGGVFDPMRMLTR